MKKILFGLALLAGCKTVTQNPEAKPSPTAKAFTPEDIKALVAQSPVASYSWKNRGKAPLSYLQGMGLVFARSVCQIWDPHVQEALRPKGSVNLDALTHYGLEVNLVNVYTLLTGLGMRESSGQYCEGKDQAANTGTAEEAEAGLFQTSYNSRYSHPPKYETPNPILVNLIKQYQAKKDGCLLEVFKPGVTCGALDAVHYGTGPGRDFQILSKSCPAFTAEYTAVMIRVNGGARGHYGPLRKKEAEFLPSLKELYSAIEAKVKESPNVCALL